MEENRYTGENLVVLWDIGGQSYNLTGDHTALTFTWGMQAADLSAGGDGGVEERATLHDVQGNLTVFHLGTAGTAVWNAVQPGYEGTVSFGPEGTAEGLPKGQFRVFMQAKPIEISFNEGVTRSVDFRGLGTVLASVDVDTWGTAAPPPAPSGGATLIFDQFTDTNGTAITAHTISPVNTPSATWGTIEFITAGAPTNQIINNQAQITTNQTGVVADAGTANGTILAVWTPQIGQANRGRLAYRGTGSQNVWALYMNEPGSTYEIQEITTGTVTQRATAAQTWVEGTSYDIKLVLNGDAMEAFVDAVSTLTHSSSVRNTATQHGIGMTSGHSGYFDDFKVIE